eukprot:329689_1
MYFNFIILFTTILTFTCQSQSISEKLCVTSSDSLFNGEYTYAETIGGTALWEQTLGKYCRCSYCADGKIYIRKNQKLSDASYQFIYEKKKK